MANRKCLSINIKKAFPCFGHFGALSVYLQIYGHQAYMWGNKAFGSVCLFSQEDKEFVYLACFGQLIYFSTTPKTAWCTFRYMCKKHIEMMILHFHLSHKPQWKLLSKADVGTWGSLVSLTWTSAQQQMLHQTALSHQLNNESRRPLKGVTWTYSSAQV